VASPNSDSTIEDFPSWYHKIKLPDGTVTPGWFPPRDDLIEWYGLPEDLGGKTVLDIGAFDGFWTFLSLERGAHQVIAIDDWSDRIMEYGSADHYPWDTFDFCREKLGYKAPRCQRYTSSIYDVESVVSPNLTFDIILFLGTIYHLRYPLLALDTIAKLCKPGTELYVESAVCDQYSPYLRNQSPNYEGRCVMEFYPSDQLGKRNTNWWAPNIQCLVNMMASAGFGELDYKTLTDQPRALGHCRAMVSGVYTGEKVKDGQVLRVNNAGRKTTTPNRSAKQYARS